MVVTGFFVLCQRRSGSDDRAALKCTNVDKQGKGRASQPTATFLQCQSRQLMHCDTLKQDIDSTVRGDGGGRVGEVRAGTTSPMPEHKGFKLQ